MVIALLASGCAHKATSLTAATAATGNPPDGTVHVGGTVVDDAHAPIANAVVALGGRTASTGPDGRFDLGKVAPGPALLTVAHPAYVPQQRPLVLVDGQDLDLLFSLAPLPRSAPYVTTTLVRGFLACSLPIDVGDETCANALGAGQKDTFAVPVNRSGLRDLLWEVTYQSTLPGPAASGFGRMVLYVTRPDGQPVQWVTGYAYLRLEASPDKAFGTAASTGVDDAHFHVGVPHLGCPIACGGDPGSVAWQQPFDAYLSGAYFRAFAPGEKAT